MRTNIDRMRELDQAWNERRWADVGELVSERIVAHTEGGRRITGRDAYLEAEVAFCGTCPDAHRHSGPYVAIFASADGRRTAAITRFTGTLHDHGSGSAEPFDVSTCVVCTWTSGVVTEQYRFIEVADTALAVALAT